MSFQPIIPYGGIAGWSFLQRTQEAQQKAFEASPVLKRDADYFAENIATISTAEQLVNDYRLLKVALGAFGLDDDLPNKAFVQKVLEEGSLDPESFANRMVDKRYLALTKAFSFDLSPPNTQLSDFAPNLLSDYKTRQFEVAVGEQNTELRLSMALERDLGEIIAKDNTDAGKWFSVMGNEPLRKVFETALGLSPSFAMLDLDQQLSIFRERSQAIFGKSEMAQFGSSEKREELNRLFLVRTQLNAGGAAMSSGSIALTLLQGATG